MIDVLIVSTPPAYIVSVPANIPDVPFYSQFKDISSSVWQKVGCGITSLAMIIDYYKPDANVSVDTLLSQGIKAGAYNNNAGWSYSGLISVSKKYGLDGIAYDLKTDSLASAFIKMKDTLKNGPVIASVHYKLDPKNPIPHLIVINGIKNDLIYYNDPAAKGGNKTISISAFTKAWKKRYIAIKPTKALQVAMNFR